MSTLFVLIIFVGFIWAAASVIIWSSRCGISPMPTSPAAMKLMMELFPKLVTGKIVDMGSGWGTLLIPLARSYHHCQVVGYELSPVPFFVSRLRQLIYQLDNLSIYQQDMMEADLAEVELVVCYLFPEAMRQLKEKFEKELPANAWIISNTFAVPGWIEEKLLVADDLYQTKVYLYSMKNVKKMTERMTREKQT